MADDISDVLFLCSGNSARSLFAESLINCLGRGRFRGFSAGSHPRGEIHPLTCHELQRQNHAADGLRLQAHLDDIGRSHTAGFGEPAA